LLGVVLVKAIIWCIALGSGTSGGILAPLLLIGGAVGGLEGLLLPGHAPGMWALIGMGAALAGATRSPLTGVIFALELTAAFDMLLPLLVGCVIAHGISVLVLRRSILTEKVARRGFHVTREYAVDPLESLRADEVMATKLTSFEASLTVASARQSLSSHPAQRAQRLFPVLDQTGALIGVITRTDLAMRSRGADATRPLAEVMRRSFVVAYSDETLRTVAARMISTGTWRLPVVARENPSKLLGLISQRELLRARERQLIEERHRERSFSMRWILPTWHHTGPA
jgi:CBS domain-containing protein